nr:MAG TPA: hypothetical protein [Caudoviricetes sp.]
MKNCLPQNNGAEISAAYSLSNFRQCASRLLGRVAVSRSKIDFGD